MEILPDIEQDDDETRPPPKRKPLHPISIWRGIFGKLTPLVVLFTAAWVYASLHVYWSFMDLLHQPLFDDKAFAPVLEVAGVAQGETWNHPFRRVSGDVSLWWNVLLVGWLGLGLVVVYVTLQRHGDGPAFRWFGVFVTIGAGLAYAIFLPARVYLFSWLLIPVVVISGLVKASSLLLGRGEKVEGVMQAWGAAAIAQLLYLPVTGFILAFGPTPPLQPLLFIPWLFGYDGGWQLAALVGLKVGLVALAAFVVPLVARKMTKF